ncbi:MAG TPA: hypothetical protein DEP36_06855 [Gammaproteobacteria bacterium]|nr:hypothetical protein [Gammaproteobacteria bacterium]HRF45458.1 nicotinamidase [Candidatus Competibacteraceae bacterium]
MQTSNISDLCQGDALIIVDVQNDFLPGGALGVSQGDQVVPLLNHYIQYFRKAELPVYATRDWHPSDHCSFTAQGGIWPPHCIADSEGAQFPPGLLIPANSLIVSKATTRNQDAYSGFQGTCLAQQLRSAGVRRVFIGGLATDYCVLNTVKDALKEGFHVVLLKDAIRAVNLNPGDGNRAIQEMIGLGAATQQLEGLAG